VLDGPLEQYRRQFPQWSTHPVAKGTGYTARGGGHRAWGPDLLSPALTMAAESGMLGDVLAVLAFSGRPGSVAADCGHPVVAGEWQTGFRTCGSCPPLPGP